MDATDPTDLIALSGTGDQVTLLRGTGLDGGFFAPQVILDLGFEATDMVAGDFNQDGRLDLAFLDPQSHQVVIYLGDGAGRFSRRFSVAAGMDPSGLSVALFRRLQVAWPRPIVVDTVAAGLVGIGLYWFLGRSF